MEIHEISFVYIENTLSNKHVKFHSRVPKFPNILQGN